MKTFCSSFICIVLFQFVLCTVDAKEELKWGSTSSHSGLHANTKAIADIINKEYTQRIVVTVTQTKGFADNLKKIKNKSILLGPASIIEAFAAYNGLMNYKNNAISGLRSLWGGYIAPIHIITSKKSGITSIYMLHKMPFAMNRGTASGRLLKKFFEAQGIQPEYKNVSIATSVEAMKSEVVKGWYKAGFKDSAIVQLEDMIGINILPVTKEMIAEMNAKYPGYGLSITVPKDLYKELKNDQLSLAYVISDFAHKDMSEETVYKIVKVIWEKRKKLVDSNPALKKGGFDKMYQMAINYKLAVPFHKGAARFYQESLNKIIPTNLIPPEMKKPPTIE